MHTFLFISGTETIFVILIAVMLFGADKIPEIARGLGKGLRQLRDITNDVKREITQPVNQIKDKSEFIQIREEIESIKDDIQETGNSVKRDLKP